MMQRITGAVAICVQLDKETVPDHGPEHHTTKSILRRTFTVERLCGDAHRSVLFFDIVGANPTTLSEKLAWDVTQKAWQRLLEIFHGTTQSLNADWVCGNVEFEIPRSLESVYILLKNVDNIVDVKAPDVPAVA